MFSNSWVIQADIKFKYSASEPRFRRRDTAIINFLIHDNKKLYDISTFTSGEVTITFPRGHSIVRPCQKVRIGGVDYIQHIFNREEIVEIGEYKVNLSFEDSNGRASIQDIKVHFDDPVGTSELSYVKLIQDLQNQVDFLDSIIDNIVLKSKKGVANGVAKLGSDGRLDNIHFPDYLKKHVDTKVYLNWVHDFYVDKNGIVKYRTKDGGEENVGHPDTGSKVSVSVKITDGVATLTFAGNGSVVAKRYIYGDKTLEYTKSNGTILTGNSFPVDQTGIWTVYYRDNKNVDYIFKFNVSMEHLKEPKTDITIGNGNVDVVSDTGVSISKYSKGKRDLVFFQTGGTMFTGRFKVAEVGEYTIYVKYKDGREYLYFITIAEGDLEKVDADPPVITMVLAPSESTVTSTNKIMTVSIVDQNTVSDKRYYFRKNSDSTVVSIDTFRNNPNFGIKMTDNTQKVTIQENGAMHVYAKDSFGNDIIQRSFVNSIDKIGAYKIEYNDKWDDTKKKYIIEATIYATTGNNAVINAQPSVVFTNLTKVSGYDYLYIEYELDSIKDHQITATTQNNISSTFDVKMKGRIIDNMGSWDVNFLLYESGRVFGKGKNDNGMMGLPKDTVYDKYSYKEIVLPEKVSKLYVDTRGVLAFTDSGNAYVWGIPWYMGLGFKYKLDQIVYTPTKQAELSNLKEIYPSRWHIIFKQSDNRWYGLGGTTSFGIGYEGEASKPTLLPQNIAYNTVMADRGRTYFIGNTELYGAGWNSNAELGIPFQYPTIITTASKSTMINPLGATKMVLVSEDHDNMHFYLTNGKMYAIGSNTFWGSQDKKVHEVTGYPANDPPKKWAMYNDNQLIVSDNGAVYVNGTNGGNLGLGNNNPVPYNTFVKVNVTGKARNANMGLSGNQAILIMEDGRMLGTNESTGLFEDITSNYTFKIEGSKK